MSHTSKVLLGGFALLAVCLLIGRAVGAPGTGVPKAALVFIALWFVGAAINMWAGVSRAGYSIAEEAPVFLLVFGIPAAVAVFVWWRSSRG
jgi:hypothetical protein